MAHNQETNNNQLSRELRSKQNPPRKENARTAQHSTQEMLYARTEGTAQQQVSNKGQAGSALAH